MRARKGAALVDTRPHSFWIYLPDLLAGSTLRIASGKALQREAF